MYLNQSIENTNNQVPRLCGPQMREDLSSEFVNNTGAVISAFVIRFLESTICNLATGEISIF